VDVLRFDYRHNMGTGIAVTKSTTDPTNGSTPEGIMLDGCIITNNGVNYSQTNPLTNGNAYGVLFGSITGVVPTAAESLGLSNTIKNCIIRGNGATGLYLSGQGTSNPNQTTLVSNNIIEDNGYDLDNNDGLKIKSSRNVLVTNNYIRLNHRANVLVECGNDDTWACTGIDINHNHLEANQEQIVSGTPFGAGLLLQMYGAPGATVLAKDNWWGHVYGPVAASNPIGRGSEVILQGGLADVSTWYGQRTTPNLWFALNDQDGDGIFDADEDTNLNGVWDDSTTTETNRAVKDTDGDGYEDGAEVASQSDPRDLNSIPASVLAKSLDDADVDGYLDFYEIEHGTDLTQASSHPHLGDINGGGTLEIGDITIIRRVIAGRIPITDSTSNADLMDLNRDGFVSNIDAIGLRRAAVANQTTFKLPMLP
jgi:hypothetical protein